MFSVTDEPLRVWAVNESVTFPITRLPVAHEVAAGFTGAATLIGPAKGPATNTASASVAQPGCDLSRENDVDTDA